MCRHLMDLITNPNFNEYNFKQETVQNKKVFKVALTPNEVVIWLDRTDGCNKIHLATIEILEEMVQGILCLKWLESRSAHRLSMNYNIFVVVLFYQK